MERERKDVGFDRGRLEAADVAGAFGPRRMHLAALDAELCKRPDVLCGLVARDGVRVLRVMASGAVLRAVEVDCREDPTGWVFTRADTGEPIGPAGDPVAVAARIVQVLTGRAARRPGRRA